MSCKPEQKNHKSWYYAFIFIAHLPSFIFTASKNRLSMIFALHNWYQSITNAILFYHWVTLDRKLTYCLFWNMTFCNKLHEDSFLLLIFPQQNSEGMKGVERAYQLTAMRFNSRVLSNITSKLLTVSFASDLSIRIVILMYFELFVIWLTLPSADIPIPPCEYKLPAISLMHLQQYTSVWCMAPLLKYCLWGLLVTLTSPVLETLQDFKKKLSIYTLVTFWQTPDFTLFLKTMTHDKCNRCQNLLEKKHLKNWNLILKMEEFSAIGNEKVTQWQNLHKDVQNSL